MTCTTEAGVDKTVCGPSATSSSFASFRGSICPWHVPASEVCGVYEATVFAPPESLGTTPWATRADE